MNEPNQDDRDKLLALLGVLWLGIVLGLGLSDAIPYLIALLGG